MNEQIGNVIFVLVNIVYTVCIKNEGGWLEVVV